MIRPALVALAIAVLQLFRGVPPTTDQVFRVFGEYLDSLRSQAGIPSLSAVVVGSDDIVWEQAFGYQDLEQLVGARTDTPFHVNGLTEMFTATLVLRCSELGRLSLNDRIGRFDPNSADADLTIRQILTHTIETADGAAFSYHPERYASLVQPIQQCTGDNTFRESLANLLGRLGMIASVPGADAVELVPPAPGAPDPPTLARYTDVLDRLATPYAVDSDRHAVRSQSTSTTLTPTDGLITTALDIARFDLALKQDGVLLQQQTLDDAWQPARGPKGAPLPHGMGWFVQTFNGQTVVWQFGLMRNGYSALYISLPARKITLVLLANSDTLGRPAALPAGDVGVSPFAALFLRLVAK